MCGRRDGFVERVRQAKLSFRPIPVTVVRDVSAVTATWRPTWARSVRLVQVGTTPPTYNLRLQDQHDKAWWVPLPVSSSCMLSTACSSSSLPDLPAFVSGCAAWKYVPQAWTPPSREDGVGYLWFVEFKDGLAGD